MILLFLGSWRSTLIVVVSIPLSILVSIIVLDALGQTLNVMTLGGMALAVGILVDDATVEIENIHRNIGAAKAVRARDPRRRAADRGAGVRLDAVHLHRVRAGRVHHRRGEVAVRAAGDGGRVRDADVVLAVAHAGADDGALPARARGERARAGHGQQRGSRFFARVRSRLRAAARRRTARWLALGARAPRAFVVARSSRSSRVSLALLPLVGRDFFPTVDAGLIKLHVRGAAGHAHRGDRAALRRRSRTTIREVIPPREIETMLDNIGTPYSGINLSLSEGALISSADGADPDRAQGGPRADRGLRARAARDARASATPTRRSSSSRPTSRRRCSTSASPRRSTCRSSARSATRTQTSRSREELARADRARSRAPSTCTSRRCRARPQLAIDVDRTHGAAGRAHRSATSRATCSSRSRRAAQVAPSYWLDQARRAVPRRGADAAVPDRLDRRAAARRRSRRGDGDAAAARRTSRRSRAATAPANITHYNVARTFDVQANVEGTDLGSVADARRARRRRDRSRRCRAARTVTRQGPGREHGRRRSAASATGSCSRSCSSTC